MIKVAEPHIKEPALDWFEVQVWFILHDLGTAIRDRR